MTICDIWNLNNFLLGFTAGMAGGLMTAYFAMKKQEDLEDVENENS